MRLSLIILALVALMLVPVLILDDEIDDYLGGEEGLQRLQSFGGLAWLVGSGLIVTDLFLPIPSTAVIAGLGMIYGPWLGGLLGGIGSTLAGLVAFGGCRLMGKGFVDFLVGDANLQKLSRFFARHGLWAIALSRWMPLLPEVLCCLAGMARMRLLPFVAALACGSLAMGFAFGFMGTAYIENPIAGLIISAVIPLALWPVIHTFLRNPKPEPANRT